jgi:CRISPR-associated protein Csd2
MTALTNRIDLVLLFDVTNGNPNGDPDMGNMPRVDPETRLGLVTDVCLKRKLRNYVEVVKSGQTGYEIYVRERAVLNNQHKRAYDELTIEHESRKLPKKEEEARAVTQWMCKNFFDIRTFGAVMSTEFNAGQVRGPVQLAFARSIDPVQPLNVTITRMAVTTEREAEAQRGDNRTMGDKWIVPYGLYRAHGFVSAHLAERTGFSEEDFALVCDGFEKMLSTTAPRHAARCRAAGSTCSVTTIRSATRPRTDCSSGSRSRKIYRRRSRRVLAPSTTSPLIVMRSLPVSRLTSELREPPSPWKAKTTFCRSRHCSTSYSVRGNAR